MKNLIAILFIALAFVTLILITAIVSVRTEALEEKAIRTDEAIVGALQTGMADRLSTFFAPDVTFFIPGHPTSNDSAEATRLVRGFMSAHPVQSFEKKSMLPGSAPSLSYLKGILHTTDDDFALYATIYNGRIERFDLNEEKK
ncbi:DUF4783 domain-containing protein [Flavilitoribacter nigricans]|nr:DUF4783 domain-containing protein [Flavilitoribacter nigricans]